MYQNALNVSTFILFNSKICFLIGRWVQGSSRCRCFMRDRRCALPGPPSQPGGQRGMQEGCVHHRDGSRHDDLHFSESGNPVRQEEGDRTIALAQGTDKSGSLSK